LQTRGVTRPTKDPIIKQKIAETNKFLYGGKSPMCSDEIKLKSSITRSKPEFREKMEELGLWKSKEEESEYKKYRKMVDKITRIQIKMYAEKYLDNYNIKNENENIKNICDKWTIDHEYSIYDGFRNNIDPDIIGSIVNLRIIKFSENSSKNKKSIINIDKLQEDFYNFIIYAV